MADHQGFRSHYSTSIEKSMCSDRDTPKNKFIFVKQNNQNVTKGSTILVNPRFKDNTKVFINPNFSANSVNDIVVSRPHIYVNPKLINSIASTSNSDVQSALPINRNPLKILPTDTRGRVLVSTKNKLIKVPQFKTNNISHTFTNPKIIDLPGDRSKKVIPTESRVLISTKNKLIKVSESKTNVNLPTSIDLSKHKNSSSNLYKKVNICPYKSLKSPENCKVSRTKIIPIQKKLFQRHSINTRFKYIKTGITKKIDNTVMRSKHKIINNISDVKKTDSQSVQHVGKNSPNFRKRFIYVSKYNSSSFLANNVILKNTIQKSFININGILYQNSPSALKKTNLSPNSQLRRSTAKLSNKSERNSGHVVNGHEGRYKLVRPQIASASKLRKSNVPCPIFKKHGKCNGLKKGTCIKIHNSNQIVLCSKFLQGACIKKNCLLSHKVSSEKMPTCKFFLEGLCSRDNCQYLHVKISPKADICRNFLEGFCKEGTKCEERHQLLCPEYEKFQKCPRRKCEYPHIPKATFDKAVPKKLSKVSKKKKSKFVNEKNVMETVDKKNVMEKVNEKKVMESLEKPNLRYYIELDNQNETEETYISKRPKLESLPSFIPLSEDSSIL